MINQLYTYFGCKKQITDIVWQILGQTDQYFEPFAGTAVCALNRPSWAQPRKIYLNDYDCHVANVLRSALYKHEELIDHICHPRLELDLHMISDYLSAPATKGHLSDKLMSRLDACDPRLAGWWVWGINHWIAGGWCNCILKNSPDALTQHYEDGPFFDGDEVCAGEMHSAYQQKLTNREKVTHRQISSLRQKLTNGEKVTHRHISSKRNKLNHGAMLTHRQISTVRKKLTNGEKMTHRQISTGRKKLTNHENVTPRLANIDRRDHVEQLVNNIYSELSEAKILYGDWKRLVTNSYLNDSKNNGIFLDPPYVTNLARRDKIYGVGDQQSSNKVFNECKKWFLENRKTHSLKIILCGHLCDFEDVPSDIRRLQWKRGSGYALGDKAKKDRTEEVLLLSDACNDI